MTSNAGKGIVVELETELYRESDGLSALLTMIVPEMLKVNLFFDEGCKSFILIWSVIGTEGC